MSEDAETRQFDTPEAFRDWLREHHDSSPSVWLCLAKKGSRTPALTYTQALLVALEHGWIDGLARRVDAETYLQRLPHGARAAPRRHATGAGPKP